MSAVVNKALINIVDGSLEEDGQLVPAHYLIELSVVDNVDTLYVKLAIEFVVFFLLLIIVEPIFGSVLPV